MNFNKTQISTLALIECAAELTRWIMSIITFNRNLFVYITFSD